MPKSTPRPTNSTANATDIMFSAPTIIEAERGGHGQSDEQIDEHRNNDARRLQRQPQDRQNDNDGADRIHQSAVLDGGEFLVRHRHRAGQAHARLIFRARVAARTRPDGWRCSRPCRAEAPKNPELDGLRSSRASRPASAAAPLSIASHEKDAGRPASTFSTVVEAIDNGRAKASSVTIWFCTPISPSESVRVSPRRLGSPASVPISGAACPSPLAIARHVVRRPETTIRCAQKIHYRSISSTERKSCGWPSVAWPDRRWPARHIQRSEHRRPPTSSRNGRERLSRIRPRACANRVPAKSAC